MSFFILSVVSGTAAQPVSKDNTFQPLPGNAPEFFLKIHGNLSLSHPSQFFLNKPVILEKRFRFAQLHEGNGLPDDSSADIQKRLACTGFFPARGSPLVCGNHYAFIIRHGASKFAARFSLHHLQTSYRRGGSYPYGDD